MKRKIRIFGGILLLMLFLNMLPRASATGVDSGKLTMTVSDSVILDGDPLCVTISADRNFVTRGAGMTICYDSSVLQPVLEETEADADPSFTISGPIQLGGKMALRISFYPGRKSVAVTAGELLAQLNFTAIKPVESTLVEMTAAYLYDENLVLLPILKADSVSVKVEPIMVSKVELNHSEVMVELGKHVRLTAAITPEDASDKTVTWTSSDETVATVDKTGHVQALAPGQTRITATAGECSAVCDVTVYTPPDAGYVVSMPMKATVVVDETVTINPLIQNGDLTHYNAYDFLFRYDPQMLELNQEKLRDAGITVSVDETGFNVLHYGDDKSMGTDAAPPFVLEFRARTTGKTTVTLVEARVDQSANALIENAALAAIVENKDETEITISAYPVTMSSDFEAPFYTVEPGSDFEFTPVSPYYEFNFAQSTVGGQPLTGVERVEEDVILHFGGISTEDISNLYVSPGEGGKFIIADVFGRVVIRTEKQGKVYPVTIRGTDITGNNQAQHGEDYVLTFQPEAGYTYNLKIKIGGEVYDYGRMDTQIIIPGSAITGQVQVSLAKSTIINPDVTPTMYHSITLPDLPELSGGSSSVENGGSITFHLDKQTGYSYQVSCTMGGVTQSLWPDANDNYTIANITADVVVTVMKTPEPQQQFAVEVFDYISLKHQQEQTPRTMYLVLVTGNLDDSMVYTYNGSPMYFSNRYMAWCYLTVEEAVLTPELAKQQVDRQTNQPTVIQNENYDINRKGTVDINDAQLVYDMYNAKYESFDKVTMYSFLLADVNSNKTLDVNDVVMVFNAIP